MLCFCVSKKFGYNYDKKTIKLIKINKVYICNYPQLFAYCLLELIP